MQPTTPKLIVTGSGLGGRLIEMSEERAKDPTAQAGPLLENFAIGEVARQLTWAEELVQLFHYSRPPAPSRGERGLQRVPAIRARFDAEDVDRFGPR